MPEPSIRRYNDRDWDNGLQIFYTTLDTSMEWEPARTIGSYLWYRAYVSLSPETCFVLDDGTGRAVGYIIGTVDTMTFVQRWIEEFVPSIDGKLVPSPDIISDDALMEQEVARGLRKELYSGECSMLQDDARMVRQYSAHFHIDILPSHQSQGWGAKMIDKFLERVKALGASGVHLGMLRSNVRAKQFYERLGFHLWNKELDGSESGGQEKSGEGALCLIKEL